MVEVAQHRDACGGGAVGEAPMWMQSARRCGTHGGGAVGQAPAWRRSVQRRGGRGGGVGTGGCVVRK
jgi:hypothetical protein